MAKSKLEQRRQMERLGYSDEQIDSLINGPRLVAKATSSDKDFSESGLGIGGAGSHIEDSVIPTNEQAERQDQRARQMRRCRHCGATSGNAMFTCDPARQICDDCFG